MGCDMTREEKILLLQFILEDIRCNWGWENEPRIPKAKELALELGLEAHVKRIKSYEDCDPAWKDGIHFRTSYERGGYVEMQELHGLDRKVKGKSADFINACFKYLTYPSSLIEAE